jgi:hypothetical protein
MNGDPRTLAAEALEWWLQTTEGRSLTEIPCATAEGLRNRLEAAFRAGFEAGHKAGRAE